MSLGQGSDLGVADVLLARGHHLTTACPILDAGHRNHGTPV